MSGIPRQSETVENEIIHYDRELNDYLNGEGTPQTVSILAAEAPSVPREKPSGLLHVAQDQMDPPALSVQVWDERAKENTNDGSSIHSYSTADETVSFHGSVSVGSAAESQDSRMTASARTAHRSYLSPLRSKRYDGLRSSLSPSGGSPRPNHLSNRSRTSSVASMLNLADMADDHNQPKPRETVKWTKLRKVTEQLYSEVGRRTFGRPTCFVVSGVLAIGTSKGLILIYDYQQICKHVIGGGSDAVEAGSVTAIALSADHTYVASGHEDGSIFSWELRNSSSCAKSIPPIKPGELVAKAGHICGARITHIGFVGARHSCFITSDCRGMTFYHNLSRRLLISNMETTRIIGRYPPSPGGPAMKPSTTYSSSVLPLGPLPHFTDTLGLVAVLTPYKLVIVSTSPVPRTHFKYNRPVGTIAECEDISACAAWFPSVRLAPTASSPSDSLGTKPTLAFSWCRQLRILTVEPAPCEQSDDPVAKSIIRTNVKVLKEFRCSESIVALQWYSADIVSLLTKSNKMLLLETLNLTKIGQCDLLNKHILHHDIYTSQLKDYFEEREAEFVVQDFADNYTYSFQTYKRKTFLLGIHDMSVGTLLTWADKVLAFTANAQYVEAMQLLIGYHEGTVQLGGLELPPSIEERQAKLRAKLQEVMISSTTLTLSSEDLSLRSDTYQSKLLAVCFEACLAMDDSKFLFDSLFEIYDDMDRSEPFLNLLAVNILDDSITAVPPYIVQQVVNHFTAQGLHTRLEDIVCHLAPDTLDANHILQLCRKHHLLNAMVYIMTETLQDFVAPMVEFTTLIKAVLRATHTKADDVQNDSRDTQLLGINTVNAVKVFPYLSLTLRGMCFPSARDRVEAVADHGKSLLYWFLFSGGNIAWPPNSGCWITTEVETPEPTFPYLRLLLLFDTPTFLASMDEAFEDSFLNDGMTSSPPDQYVRKSITRQFIVNVLLDVTNNSFPSEDAIYLYMFIARNVPKYPQFILLSGSVLQKIIIGLCHYEDPEIAEDCQLSVEYILSMFRPSDSSMMLKHYREARFFRVLKSIYRTEHRWVDLLLANIRAAEQDSQVFDCIEEVLGSQRNLTLQERDEVQETILQHIVDIASLDGIRAAEVIDRCAPCLHRRIFDALLSREGLLYIYLRQLLKVENKEPEIWIDKEVVQKYIDLLCIYEPDTVLDYIKLLDLNRVDVFTVIQNLEKYDLIDSVVYLMSIQGKREAALARVIERLKTLWAIISVKTIKHNMQNEIAMSIDAIGKYARLGAGLCQVESSNTSTASIVNLSNPSALERSDRSDGMWIDLVKVVFEFLFLQGSDAIERSTSVGLGAFEGKHGKHLRNIVQDLFTQLLTFTMSTSSSSFATIFMAVLDHVSKMCSTSYIREVVRDIFNGHQFYFQLLNLSDNILASELFVQIEAKNNAYQRGWRARDSICRVCQERCHGHLLKKSFRERQQALTKLKIERQDLRRFEVEKRHGSTALRTAGKQRNHNEREERGRPDASTKKDEIGERDTRLISFACGHLVHENCYASPTTEIENDIPCCPSCS